jgi:hypothetical protein
MINGQAVILSSERKSELSKIYAKMLMSGARPYIVTSGNFSGEIFEGIFAMRSVVSSKAADSVKALQRAGIHLLSFLGNYSPEDIAAVKAAVRVPVIGNGDIMSAEDALNMKKVTGCDGLMIARGSMGNPWLFSEIAAALEKREFTPPTLEERVKTAIGQMVRMIEEKGERVGFAESKKQLAWYIHGVAGAADARGRLMTATSPQEAEQIMLGLIR